MRRRRKPRLFSFPCEIELSHYRGLITDEAEEIVLRNAIDAFIEIAHTKRITERSLSMLVAAARHPSSHLRGLGLLRLTVLSHYFGEAVDALAALSVDEDVELRRFMAPMLANTPPGVAGPLVRRLLQDEDWTVRKVAAQVGTAVAYEDLIPVLSRRIARERDARVRIALRLALDFQRSAHPAP